MCGITVCVNFYNGANRAWLWLRVCVVIVGVELLGFSIKGFNRGLIWVRITVDCMNKTCMYFLELWVWVQCCESVFRVYARKEPQRRNRARESESSKMVVCM